MSATETITSNPRVLGADPLVETGIGEEDFVTIILPYIHSARKGCSIPRNSWNSTEPMR